ncbi:MAG: hypothetical protein U0103_26480 [Candidatus Obscuribacterales bacterium]|nr:hypothetical protein [Cyanobacteria bacterium SZAS LIN-5]RTL46184.1 MAG: hypothetical protein EKK48_02280 [Candidatus Melainabacteria bacterium]
MKGKNQKLLARTIGLAMQFALVATFWQASMPCFAADADSADPNVPKLEKKFFEHTYPKDPLPQRLERIEKMVFGEAKSGPDGERLSKLIQAVPGLNSVPDVPAAASGSNTTAAGDAQDVPMAPPSKSRPPQAVADGTKYPQVSAMEQRLLGKEFASEPVDQRLARLETKVFGKPSSSTDLSDRVDALKSRTGVDITKQVPAGADWADDDDTFMPPPTAQHRAPSSTPGADGRSFSGRDLRNDLNSAFNRSNRSGNSDDQDVPFTGSGSYGRGSSSAYSSPSASGAYGFGGSSTGSSGASGSYGFGGSGYQRSTPPRTAYQSPSTAYQPAPQSVPDMSSGLGLNQQVTALEQEVLNKTYTKDPLPVRVDRLETNIIPKDKVTWQGKPLPDRVSHLVSIIPISAPSMVKNQRVAQSPDADIDPDFPDMASAGNMPKPAPQRSGGLSKIMNSLGNMLGGGSGFSTGYGMSGNLMTDPQTGLLMDPNSGNLIDPTSGMVIGRRVVQPNYGYNPYGMGGMGGMGMNGFGNGFSPYGSSYGIGGSGIRMGIGGGRVGGMWP